MADAESPAGLKGKRVLVVEDETLISMLFEDILAELDCTIVGPALNLTQAMALAQTAAIDAAVLDVNLGGDPIFPVAEILADRGVPLVFSSGYGASGLPDRWQSQLTLPKPFTSDQFAAVLQRLVAA